MAYLFACNVGTLVSFVHTHVAYVARRPRERVYARCVRAARLCICASGTKPLDEYPGQRPPPLKTRDRGEKFYETLRTGVPRARELLPLTRVESLHRGCMGSRGVVDQGPEAARLLTNARLNWVERKPRLPPLFSPEIISTPAELDFFGEPRSYPRLTPVVKTPRERRYYTRTVDRAKFEELRKNLHRVNRLIASWEIDPPRFLRRPACNPRDAVVERTAAVPRAILCLAFTV